MYAQLCKRLSEEAPNFDSPSKHSTFVRLLLRVCEDKFINRSSGITVYDGPLTQEDDEKRHVAKQRMLGNVKFIGELHKLQMLSTDVLHKCIQELLDKRKSNATMQDRCEDMECLCQLVRTCGKNLDTEKGKRLMDQYFEKMDQRSKSHKYPPRIRFMLRDIIELRENNWIPRKVGTTEGPVPIRQIRTDDDSIIRPPYINRNRDMRNNERDNDNWISKLSINLQPGYNDMFSSLSVSSPPHITSPNYNSNNNNRHYNQRNNQNNHNNYNNRFNKHNQHNQHNNSHNTSSYTNMMNNKDLAPRFKRNLITANQDPVENLQMRPSANSLLFKANMNIKSPAILPIVTPPPSSTSMNNSSSSSGTTSSSISVSPLLSNLQHHHQQQQQQQHQSQHQHHHQQQQQHTKQNQKSSFLTTSSAMQSSQTDQSQTTSMNSLNVNSQNSMRSSSSNNAMGAGNGSGNQSSVGYNNSSMQQLNVAGMGGVGTTGTGGGTGTGKDQTLITKSGSTEKSKQGKKDKGPSKDEVLKRVTTFLNDNLIINEEESNEKNIDDIVKKFNELKVPDKYWKDSFALILNEIIDKSELQYERCIEFLQQLRKDNKQSNALLEAFKIVVNKMNEKEATIPRIKTLVAKLLAKAVNAKLCKLNDIANYTENGQHYPLFLLVLQQLHKILGKDELQQLFTESKINLLKSLPEADRTKERMSNILEDRNLNFLYPLIKLQAELWKQINLDSNPSQFYAWIKRNVDPKYYNDPGFIQALMTVVLKYITQETSLTEGIEKNSKKSVSEKDQELITKYCNILDQFLNSHGDLQLIALYALQVHCCNIGFPKGMLCWWFKNLWEANVIEDDVFIKWKEEINDEYPGKGEALFQVNTWLTWLEQAESEDED